MTLKAGQQLGGYTVKGFIAEGGMAEIYLAARNGWGGFQAECVLKRVKDNFRLDPKFRAMFELEAKLAGNLTHDNIVRIHDFQNEGGELILAMEYVNGCSLDHLRRRVPHKQMPPFIAARVVRDVASALSYAHGARDLHGNAMGLVHRDVSPHNVLISRSGMVKLADFGIAKPISHQTSGGMKGKLAYMAPEQAMGQKCDGRTDLYALGVVLFELVAGTGPFVIDNIGHLVEILGRSNVPAPRASTIRPDLPPTLDALIAKALERDPAKRFQVASEMGAALDDLIRQAPRDAELDLRRFVLDHIDGELWAEEQPEPLPTGALDATHISATGVLPAPTTIEPAGTIVSTQPVLPVAPRAEVREPEPTVQLEALPPPAAPAVEKLPAILVATQAVLPEPREEPEQQLPPPAGAAPLLSLRGKLALALAGAAVLGLTAFLTVRSRKGSAPGPVLAKAAVEAPSAAPPPEAPAPSPVAAVVPESPKAAEDKPKLPETAPAPAAVASAAPAPEAEHAPAAPIADVKEGAEPAPGSAAAHAARPAAAGAAPKVEPGHLQVTASPYAVVFEGRTRLCEETPCSATVSAGSHRLRFISGTRVYFHDVRVGSNAHVCVHADFTRKSPSVTPCVP